MICYEFYTPGAAKEIHRLMNEKITLCNDKKICIKKIDFSSEKQIFNEINERIRSGIFFNTEHIIKYETKGC